MFFLPNYTQALRQVRLRNRGKSFLVQPRLSQINATFLNKIFFSSQTGTFISDAEILVVTSSYLLVKLSESCIGYVSARQARSTPEDKTNLKEKYK